MPVTEIPSHTVALEPLAPLSFAPFGDVAERPTGLRRRMLPTALDRAQDAKAISLWISSAAAIGRLPLRLTMLERHPFSAQSFVPLDRGRYLAIVCEAGPGGAPNLLSLRAFLASSHQSVTYARNVWHHPMTVLDQPMEFAVAMAMTGADNDDVLQDLDAEVTVVLPRAASWGSDR